MTNGFLIKNESKINISKYLYLLPLAFVLVLISFFLFYDQSSHRYEENSITAEVVTAFAFVLSSVLCFVFYKLKKLDTELIVGLLIVCGFALRLAYALRYGYNINQHDVESLNSSGHLSYIYSLAMGNGLPDSNDWQFSHPPLHHIFAALSVKASHLLRFSNGRAFENIQYLTVFYSTMTMFAGYRLLKLCHIHGKNLLLCIALLAFHPTFQILAGSINNDVLTLLLSMYAVCYLVKWCRKQTLKNAALCGLFCGLGMMTKLSAALIAVVAAVTVVIKFITNRELRFGKTVLNAGAFLCLLLPFGLWHPIRNYLLFEQPLGYVAPIPTTSALYTGDISLVDRIILPLSKDVFPVYVNVWEEYNVWFYTLRNSLFGEYSFGNEGLAVFLVSANLLLIILSLAALVYLLFKRFEYKGRLLPIFVLYFVQLIFFIYFNIKYPFGCTMDFRYIVPLLFCGVIFLGTASEQLELTKSGILFKIVSGAEFTAMAFCVLSVIVMM